MTREFSADWLSFVIWGPREHGPNTDDFHSTIVASSEIMWFLRPQPFLVDVNTVGAHLALQGIARQLE